METEKHNAEILRAMRVLARNQPEQFNAVVKSSLMKLVRDMYGSNPGLIRDVDEWFDGHMSARYFKDAVQLLPSIERPEPITNTKGMNSDIRRTIKALENLFEKDPLRWDSATIQQFVIIGVVARSEGPVRMHALCRAIGYRPDIHGDGYIEGANLVRAANIVLTRWMTKFEVNARQLIVSSGTPGPMRLFDIQQPSRKKYVWRFIANHPAADHYL